MSYSLTYIYQQPVPIENFCYDSLIKKHGTLECEFVLCTSDDIQNIYVVIDLYMQLQPLRLAPYCIKEHNKKDVNFIVNRMERISPGYYKCKLENCHIQMVSNKTKFKYIKTKLKDLQKWQYGNELSSIELDRIDNIVATDYDNTPLEEKVSKTCGNSISRKVININLFFIKFFSL